jgi:uncharacterized membrane protein YdbT with pleckstrin-like domain
VSDQPPDWLTLDEGEEIAWVGEPELASKAGEFVIGIALLPLLGIGLLVILPAYLQVTHTDYVVTNQSLYAKSGILSTNIQSLELDKIQNTEYSQSFVEKQLGYGTVGVDTAGGTGIELEFEAIAGAREVQETVRELSKQYREAAAGTDVRDPDGDGAGDLGAVADELERTREALENVEAAISEALSARQGSGSVEASASGRASRQAGEPTAGRDDDQDGSERDESAASAVSREETGDASRD